MSAGLFTLRSTLCGVTAAASNTRTAIEYGLRPDPDYGSKVHMKSEEKLMLCVLLQALAERDPRFVVMEHQKGSGKQRKPEKLAAAATEYCASKEFADIAESIGFDPEFLRRSSPEQAYRALQYFLDTNTNFERAAAEIAGAVPEVREEAVPACGVKEGTAPLLALCGDNQAFLSSAAAA